VTHPINTGNGQDKPVEVTPAMVQAGVTTLYRSGLVDDPLGADSLVVADIYRAMFSAFFSEKKPSPTSIGSLASPSPGKGWLENVHGGI
jgi:hypothetical protein